MRVMRHDCWTYPHADAICVTTNGSFVRVGPRGRVFRGVMGRGVAKQAVEKFPDMELRLGTALHNNGNRVAVLRPPDDAYAPFIVAFPVKHKWHEAADPELIWRSCQQLVILAETLQWQTVVLPRPGCGNGRLAWTDIAPLIASALDDRFVVVTI